MQVHESGYDESKFFEKKKHFFSSFVPGSFSLSFQPILKWPKDSESSDSLLSQPSGLEMYDGYIGMHGGFQNGEIRKIVPKTGFCNLEPPSRLPDALQKFGAFSGPSRSSPQRLGSSGCFISDIQPLEYCDNSKISVQKLMVSTFCSFTC